MGRQDGMGWVLGRVELVVGSGVVLGGVGLVVGDGVGWGGQERVRWAGRGGVGGWSG